MRRIFFISLNVYIIIIYPTKSLKRRVYKQCKLEHYISQLKRGKKVVFILNEGFNRNISVKSCLQNIKYERF